MANIDGFKNAEYAKIRNICNSFKDLWEMIKGITKQFQHWNILLTFQKLIYRQALFDQDLRRNLN